jgi:KDO2-lipid IV(A) lauroyltransferase
MTGPEERSERVAATPRPRREHVRRLVDAATSLLLLGLWVAMWPVPRSWLLGLAHALAPLIARLNQFRVARKNLRIIRSVHPAAWRGLAEDQLVASAVGHQLCTIVDLFKLVASSGPETIAVTTVVGWERLEALSQARRGLVLVAAHQGNWEVTGAALAARGLPVHAFYFEQLAPSLDRFLAWARARSGMRLLHRQRGLRECLRVLRQGGAVGFVADQDGSKDGIWVEFLGRLVSMPRGPYEFARHAGCPVVPLSCRRLADDSYEIVIDEPLPVEEPAEVERVCHEVVARFEARVAATPEQWQLFYDRFWLRHIPRLAELGLLERAHRETERDRLLAQSPESTG